MSAALKGAAADAYAALQQAMERANPLCRGDNRFIQDELTSEQKRDMAELCSWCPLLAQCTNFAPHADAGFWAGKWRAQKGRTNAS